MPKAKPLANQNTFLLRSLKKLNYYDTITVCFAPKVLASADTQVHTSVFDHSQQDAQASKRETVSIIPTYNNDRKYYTACFVNPIFQGQDSDALLLATHREKVRESLRQTPREYIMVAKPRKRVNSYCSVCKEYYEDYMQHISRNQHKEAIKGARFAKDIIQLVKMYGQEPQEGILTRAARRRLYSNTPNSMDILKKKQVTAQLGAKQKQQRQAGEETPEKEARRELSTLLRQQEEKLSFDSL